MADVTFTVFGASGFVGRHLVEHLRSTGACVHTPSRADISNGAIESLHLGHVIYAIGLTGDFRIRISDTVNAHVCLLDRLMNATSWESWLYLSSTRVYGAEDTGRARHEDETLSVLPSHDSVYDLSKLLGEALVLSRPDPQARVARLSNVFGPDMPKSTFLASILNDAAAGRDIVIREDPESAKDYVSVDFARQVLMKICTLGKHRTYNVASGILVRHRDIAGLIVQHLGTGVRFENGAKLRRLPRIDIGRLREEFGIEQDSAMQKIETLIRTARTQPTKE